MSRIPTIVWENDSISSCESINRENIKRTLKILSDSEEKLNSISYSNVTLILGNNGSGKTTLARFLAKDEGLISTEVGEDTGEFIVSSNSGDEIGDTGEIFTTSTIPKLFVDRDTNTAIIDCPPFNGYVDPCYEISTAHLVKKVADGAKYVKIVLTVCYHSVRKGTNCSDFLQLLERVTSLFKNIDKYARSVALVVTKVDNNRVFRNEQYISVPDDLIIRNIAEYLLEVRKSLRNVQNDKLVSKISKNCGNLVDILLQGNRIEYFNLAIFRCPDSPGPLCNNKMFQDAGKIIQKMINRNLKYAPVDVSDTGYAVSNSSKQIVKHMVDELNVKITNLNRTKFNLIDCYNTLEEKQRRQNIDSSGGFFKNLKNFFYAQLSNLERNLIPVSNQLCLSEPVSLHDQSKQEHHIQSSIPKNKILTVEYSKIHVVPNSSTTLNHSFENHCEFTQLMEQDVDGSTLHKIEEIPTLWEAINGPNPSSDEIDSSI